MSETSAAPRLLSGAEFKADPYPAYASLREQAPVYCRTSADGSARMWFLTRYEDVAEALRDHRRFVKDVHSTLTAEERAALGITDALRDEGIQEGETVRIGKTELTWEDAW